MIGNLDARIPHGPLAQKWDRHKFEMKLVNPANKRKYSIIVVGTGLAGASAAASLGELKRFAQRFGVSALIDRDSKRYQDLGLAHSHYTDERWLERLSEEPLLLKMPLARSANRLTIGLAETEWVSWFGT